MPCPRCLDDHQPERTRCPVCGDALAPSEARAADHADALLGRFHPVLAERISATLAHRAIAHRVVARDDDVEVHVDRDHRDDLRAELALTWTSVVHRLPEDDVRAVLALGGASPGWYDAPRGGWVNRAGRLVVEAEEEERAADAARLAGPAIAALGAVVGLLGWYTDANAGLIAGAVALLVVGVLLPR